MPGQRNGDAVSCFFIMGIFPFGHVSIISCVMARLARNCPKGYVYHVLNRSAGRFAMFRRAGDFEGFISASPFLSSVRVPQFMFWRR